MRRVEVAHPLAAAEIDDFAVAKHARRAVRQIVQGHRDGGFAVRHQRVRRDREPLVHGSALVGLHVPERDPAQVLRWHEPAHGFAYQGKHPARPGVEQQRLVPEDQELVEGEAGGCCHFGHEGRQPEDAISDFIDAGIHGGTCLVREGSCLVGTHPGTPAHWANITVLPIFRPVNMDDHRCIVNTWPVPIPSNDARSSRRKPGNGSSRRPWPCMAKSAPRAPRSARSPSGPACSATPSIRISRMSAACCWPAPRVPWSATRCPTPPHGATLAIAPSASRLASPRSTPGMAATPTWPVAWYAMPNRIRWCARSSN